ncbi:A/G-specific adenine glycosylase [Methylotenera sp. G11]|uniref:A/G-specific adenine glycosylase n=1 Tax=Methylotenera sp. G11 TaxID=1506585 RepID=UPI000645913C|nr:A/G-specific adenine glycosylase [Methylotenera sp. G11]
MTDFSSRLIVWQKQHGRHDLPWQNTTDPYAIWVSEIMLQQTQVTAVIGYYSKFMQRFPTIAALADATQDEVLQHWSGLGYYSRARNLHNAAQTIMDEHGGVFPQDFATIQALPGIGRSTAAAIASFAFNQVQTILDGNVKRVLARHFAVEGWPGTPKIEKELWSLAESLLPKTEMVAYTQGLMDLGATLCSRSRPQCLNCPLLASCQAYRQQRVNQLPTPKPRKATPEKHTIMLILLQGDSVMLEKRPPSGIWGGLWSFPELEQGSDYTDIVQQRFGMSVCPQKALPELSHAFTHFKLHITPQPLQVNGPLAKTGEPGQVWLSIADALGAAIPTPVRKILQTLLIEGT